jgi:hypothetical protein
MKRLLRFILRFLNGLGLGRHFYHVDLGTVLHLTAETLDSASGSPVDGATSFQIHALPTDADQAALLDLGQVNLVAS